MKKLLSLSVGETLMRGAKFLFFLSLAHRYGTSTVGAYSYLVSIFGIIVVASDLGITKNITLSLLHRDTLSKNAIILRLFLFLSGSLLFIDSFLSFWLFLIFFADVIAEMIYAILRAREAFEKEAKIKLAIASFYAIASLGMWLVPWSATTIFSLLASALLFWILLFANIVTKSPLSSKNFTINWPLYIGSLMTIVYFRADIVIVQHFLGNVPTGIYAAAMKLIEIALIFSAILGNYLLPKLAKRRNYLLQNIGFGLFLTLLFYFGAPYLIHFLYPKSFALALPLAKILSFAIFAIIINNYIFTLFLSQRREYYYALITSLMGVGNILGNMLIISLGIQWVAWMTVFTEMAGMVLGFWIYRSKIAPQFHSEP